MQRQNTLAVIVFVLTVCGVASQARGLILADSVSQFSGVQGQDNWFYGYIAPVTSLDFLPMTEFNGGSWFVDEGTFWTSLRSHGGHPNGEVTSGGRQPVEHWAVRRWISIYDGHVIITGVIGDDDIGGPDGAIALILLDGVEIFSKEVADDTEFPNTESYRVVP